MTSKNLQKFKKIVEGSFELEFAMTQIEKILQVKLEIRDFIVLDQIIADREDPQSLYNGNTINEILECFECPRSTYYYKSAKYRESGIYGLIPKKRGPKKGRLPGQILYRIEDLRDLEMTSKNISTIISVESGFSNRNLTLPVHFLCRTA